MLPSPTPRRVREAANPLRGMLYATLALLVSLPLLLLGTVAAPAQAATLDGMLSFAGFHVGAFHSSNGASAYCLEPAADAPFGAQLEPGVVTMLPAYSISVSDPWGFAGTVSTEEASGEILRRMNWVLSEHGQGADAEQAVAVQVALWELRRGPGNAAWIDSKYALIAQHGGQAYVDAGLALAATSATAARAPGNAVPSSELSIGLGTVHGSGSVAYPAGTTELTIEGGTFLDGSTVLRIIGGAAGEARWIATLHEPDWADEHTVTVSGRWRLDEEYWPAEIVLYPPTVDAEQRLGAGVSPIRGTNEGAFEPVSTTIGSRFAPRVTTAVVSGFVARDPGEFGDSIMVDAAPGGAPWPSRAGGVEFLPLRADGTLYGPFAAPQTTSDAPPSGAPVAARSSIELDDGPGSYEARETVSSLEAGYYYWVWEIREEAQRAEVRASGLLEPGGVYSDRFGEQAERQLVPTELRWVTQLERRELPISDRLLRDRIRVSLQGGAWLRDDAGERLPARIRLTAYRTAERPERQGTQPFEAEELGSAIVEVRDPDTWVSAPEFEVPADAIGWVTVRACLLDEEQFAVTRGSFAEWCDDFGIPEETAELLQPPAPLPEAPLAKTGGGSALSALSPVGIAGVAVGAGAMILARFRRFCAASPNSIHRIRGNP